MRSSYKVKNRIGLLRIPRILPNKFLLKMNRTGISKLPSAIFPQIIVRKM
jgi:hypothetical protein